MHKVTIMPSGESISIREDESLLVALKEAGKYVKSSCGGHASCSDCIVKVMTGEDYVNPPEFDELQLIGNVFHITKERLACQTKVTGDITIDLSNHDLKKDQAKSKAKTSAFSKTKSKSNAPVRVRSKEQVEEIKKEREEQWQEKVETNDKWHKHWEKDAEGLKKLGGGKRPKEFRTDHIDHERDAALKERAEETRIARERYEKSIPKTFNDKAAAPSPEASEKQELIKDDFVQPERSTDEVSERKSFRKKK